MFAAILVLFASTSVLAKFSSDIKFIPCLELKIRSSSCVPHVESNQAYIEEKRRKLTGRPDLQKMPQVIEYRGARIRGKIQSQVPRKCFPDQEIRPSMAINIPELHEEFFVAGLECPTGKKQIDIVAFSKPSFCDTPGALDIEACFRSSLHRGALLLDRTLD